MRKRGVQKKTMMMERILDGETSTVWLLLTSTVCNWLGVSTGLNCYRCRCDAIFKVMRFLELQMRTLSFPPFSRELVCVPDAQEADWRVVVDDEIRRIFKFIRILLGTSMRDTQSETSKFKTNFLVYLATQMINFAQAF